MISNATPRATGRSSSAVSAPKDRFTITCWPASSPSRTSLDQRLCDPELMSEPIAVEHLARHDLRLGHNLLDDAGTERAVPSSEIEESVLRRVVEIFAVVRFVCRPASQPSLRSLP